jgi:hypothetical protein
MEKTAMDTRVASDMDGGWKQIIDDFLEEFFLFFFPAVHALIDFHKEYRLLDKELAGIMAGAAVGRREADKLLEVHWKAGGRDLLLVHVEVQAQEDPGLSERMFVYNSRIRAKYGRPVASMALLVDDVRSFRPAPLHCEVAGCVLSFTYPVVKLLDFKSEAELLADPSPFAIASLVQLRKLKAKGDVQRKFRYKVELARELIHREYSKDFAMKLLRFMDYVLTLPAELAGQYQSKLQKTEGSSMVYLADFEQKALEKGIEQGIEKGIEQGIEKGIREGVVSSLREVLEIRFGEVPESLLDGIEQTKSVDELKALLKRALTATSIDQVFAGK